MRNEFRWATLEEIDDLLAKRIEEELLKVVPQIIDGMSHKQYVTNSEAARITGRSTRSLDHLRKTGQIDFYMNGNRVLFKYTDLIDWIKAGHVIATKPKCAV